MRALLALDQGTTSTRAIAFDVDGHVLGTAARPLANRFPRDGWVEQEPEEIWAASHDCLREATAAAGLRPSEVAAIGLANQRETVVLWDRATSKALGPAIVWQDRRTAERCADLRVRGVEGLVQRRTGLLLDPYFSATKIAWLLDHHPGARTRGAAGALAAGTIDSWLLWRLSGGDVHATDATNASRTMLFDIHRQRWDEDLLALFEVPLAVLPEVHDCARTWTFTTCLGASVPLCAMVGDQQAAAIGQGCIEPGMVKATLGTGCFVLAHAGDQVPASRHRLLATVAWRLGGATRYALEGAVFNAGTVVQWLRDALHAIPDAAASEALARQADPASQVHLVPAFTGLGAPWWDPHARGVILGITRATTLADIVHAGLASIAFQVQDLLAAMAEDGLAPAELRVDGGMANNRLALELLAESCALAVAKPQLTETTAWGAAMLAGLGVGIFHTLEQAARSWTLAERTSCRAGRRRSARAAGRAWRQAVERVRSGSRRRAGRALRARASPSVAAPRRPTKLPAWISSPPRSQPSAASSSPSRSPPTSASGRPSPARWARPWSRSWSASSPSSPAWRWRAPCRSSRARRARRGGRGPAA